jgi:hypothetical protein
MMRFLYDMHPPYTSETEPDDEDDEVVPAPEPPSLADVQAYVAGSDFVFSPNIIANYHLSLLTKPFVILTGLSGTGKTKLTRLYADAAHRIEAGAANPYYQLVAVRPDWNDHRGLLGYYNPLTETYSATEFLTFLLTALSDPQHWYYVCLDEMNLARVEYYFSDFLSAVEAQERLQLHPFKGECVTTQGTDGARRLSKDAVPLDYRLDGVLYIPASVPIPPNLLVTGTVNVDETTHAFSDKVLDRANSIEFNQADLEVYLTQYAEHHPEQADVVAEARPLLLRVYSILEPRYLHFGYRTAYEVLTYLWLNETLPEDVRLSRTNALDYQLMQKVLPKLRGDERIEEALTDLAAYLDQELGPHSQCVRKVRWMIEELNRYGSTHFWR